MNKIVCPNCNNEIEISQAIEHKIQEEVLEKAQTKYKEELKKQKKEIEEKAERRIKDELELKFKDSQNELDETKEQSRELREQLLELTKQLRFLKQKDEERELEMQKKLTLEREKIQEEIVKVEKEKSSLEIAEIKKQLDDTKKALEDAQRKAAQKSQQLQGEVLELELEKMLSIAFPHDDTEPVAKGISGADIKHTVKSPKGTICGVILWESKRTKEWSDKWLTKLKEDLRTQKANIPIIVSVILPKEAKNGFGIKDGVWICSHQLVLPIATILRKNLLDVGYQKAISANRGEKADLLYSYATSHEFQQQVERIVETYKEIKDQITKERMVFEKSWKQRETQAERIILSIANIVGNMQGRVGASMPVIKGLELTDSSKSTQQNLLEGKL
ncbi:MAG: DUF2130 domain-containing protein [Patescibacteria group bacterium]